MFNLLAGRPNDDYDKGTSNFQGERTARSNGKAVRQAAAEGIM